MCQPLGNFVETFDGYSAIETFVIRKYHFKLGTKPTLVFFVNIPTLIVCYSLITLRNKTRRIKEDLSSARRHAIRSLSSDDDGEAQRGETREEDAGLRLL